MREIKTSMLPLLNCALALIIFFSAAGFTNASSQPSAAVNVQVVSVNAGIVVLNEGKGSVVFCSFTSIGAVPQPAGKCVQIGTVTKSASGFDVTANGINAFITNKATGGVFQCTTTVVNTQPRGACKQIGDVS